MWFIAVHSSRRLPSISPGSSETTSSVGVCHRSHGISNVSLRLDGTFLSSSRQDSALQLGDKRALKFRNCVYRILPFSNSIILKPRRHRHTCGTDISVALLMVNAESDGDVYMQGVRKYDLAVKSMQDNPGKMVQAFLKQGAPMFLLCVSGPTLLVAGGFFDDNKFIVEPFGDVCMMLRDHTHARRNKLAQALYALTEGIRELKELEIPLSPPIFPPWTPRIYGSCILYDQSGPGQLTFVNKLCSTDSHELLFTALLGKPSLLEPIPVLVKLVSGEYGEDVHRSLAEQGLAPTLHAYSDPEGAPKAFIMDYLEPSAWMTLSDFAQLPDSSTFATSIRLSIDKVLEVLQARNMVHGDLRGPNIVVKVADGKAVVVDGRAVIKVLDFVAE